MAVERTVTGLGYELVDVERSTGGLLRVYIDRVPGRTYVPRHALPDPGETAADPMPGSDFVTVDDCETVTRQLQHVLEVENLSYSRLEVSSPGLDRPLRRTEDYLRFEGQTVLVTLRLPFQGRKKYQGTLRAQGGDTWRLELADGQAAGPAGEAERALDFTLEEVREARLVPVLDFKGRRRAAPANPPTAGGVLDGDRKE